MLNNAVFVSFCVFAFGVHIHSSLLFAQHNPLNFIDEVAHYDEWKQEDWQVKVPGYVLHGTLSYLVCSELPTVVLFIAGSGPTDRDGNSRLINGKNNSFKMLAEELALAGIASLRYDKRRIGASRPVRDDANPIMFSDLVNDAVAWINSLKASGQFSRIVVAGHSQGALVGKLAARETEIDALISFAGAGRPFGDLIREQYNRQLSYMPGGLALLDTLERYIGMITEGRRIEWVNPVFSPVFHPANQAFLSENFLFDPVSELSILDIPILIIQGSTDIQVSEMDAVLLAGASPKTSYVLINGMNHILKIAPLGDLESYGNPDLPVSDELVNETIRFIKSLK